MSEASLFTLSLDNPRELKADAIVVAAGRIGNADSPDLENQTFQPFIDACFNS